MTKAKPLPNAEYLREILKYNPATGEITWKKPNANNVKQGQRAGAVNSRGYTKIGIHSIEYMAHRIAWTYMTGEDPGDMLIDHIDGDTTNNRFNNLRLASKAENTRNAKKYKHNTSGFKGVCWHNETKKWRAQIRCDYRLVHLGLFDTPELAHMAYCKAAAELHGEFARGA